LAEHIHEVALAKRDVVFAVSVLGHGLPPSCMGLLLNSSAACRSLAGGAAHHSIASRRSSGPLTSSSASRSSLPWTTLTRSGRLLASNSRHWLINAARAGGTRGLTSSTFLNTLAHILRLSGRLPSSSDTTGGGNFHVTRRYIVPPRL